MNLAKIAQLKLNSIYCYKVCMVLSCSKPLTMTMLCEYLGTTLTTIRRPMLQLIENDLIEIDRIEGANKFYRLKKEGSK